MTNLGQSSDWPTTCAAVEYDMRDDDSGSWCEREIGDLLWNPKAGEGHVIVAEARCGSEYDGRRVDCGCGGWGLNPCPVDTAICECGQDDSWRDHHYELLARHTAPGA